ncbi:MAG: KamA family radical SAM protein [Candidatus Eremiobacter antarcticus]|nr:KamA family radical SAM protein [Candidatus Eremiobacteraeota bacterium]MBC5808639.1 KamA family radical SAM protein [Candidatus Eremiobacteraeota bacterium]PZR62131.1 MAG: KamA family radical SAM protein [Candidatus Eremiobacter sp. RRmetagenome_bin22]
MSEATLISPEPITPSNGALLEEPRHLKPPASPDALEHMQLVQGEFWRSIPAYQDIDEATFLNHLWQYQHSVKTPDELLNTIQALAPAHFIDDVRAGFHRAPMNVRVSPYMIACIDWSRPYTDPIRTQFIPLASRLVPDHPKLSLDSLHEQEDAPVPGLVHRYVDKALFLPTNVCPVYCRYCTRSYAIGGDTEVVEKAEVATDAKRWQHAFEYIASRPELQDIVISGGDAYQLPAKSLKKIGDALLDIPNVRRMRFASKGPAVMPMKIMSDAAWTDALTSVVERGRSMGKDVMLHTHFNHPNEITWITAKAMNVLFERGIMVRNQSVLIRGVNDDKHVMRLLVKRLGYVHVHPYYVYMHDMVKGVEDLRTTVQAAVDIEKFVRGSTAGFNTPTFVCDAPGGGGKRDVHSYDYYDRVNGIAVYSAPSVKPGQWFTYFDPIEALSPEAQARWADPQAHAEMIAAAVEKANAAA